MPDVTEVDAMTGTRIVRDFNADELKQRALDQAESERLETQRETAKASHDATTKAARDFALTLGFTPEMLAVMYPQLEESLSE